MENDLVDQLAIEYQAQPSPELYRQIVELMLPTIRQVATSHANYPAIKRMGLDHSIGTGALIVKELLRSYKKDLGIRFSKYCYYGLYQRMPSWDRVRSFKKRRLCGAVSLHDEEGEVVFDVEDHRTKREVADTSPAIESAINMLSPREQCFVRMRFFSGMSNKKIASVLGVSEQRVVQMAAAVIPKLRENLGEINAKCNL